jgi:hypothetical protein
METPKCIEDSAFNRCLMPAKILYAAIVLLDKPDPEVIAGKFITSCMDNWQKVKSTQTK